MIKDKLTNVLNNIKTNGVENWIHDFLSNEGNNVDFSNGLKLEKRYYSTPFELSFKYIERCCGPEQDKQFIIDKNNFEIHVSKMLNSISNGWKVPPLILNYENGKFTLNDGNHRYEALLRYGAEKYWAIVWATSKTDFDDFTSKYL